MLQAIKARGEAEQKRKEKKAAMARPTRASSNPNMDPAAARETQQRPAGMFHHLARWYMKYLGCLVCHASD